MEKIILVFYIDIRDLKYSEIRNYLNNVKDALKSDSDNEKQIFIPIHGESRIECLNPKMVSENDYKQAKEILEKNEKIVKELFEKFNERN